MTNYNITLPGHNSECRLRRRFVHSMFPGISSKSLTRHFTWESFGFAVPVLGTRASGGMLILQLSVAGDMLLALICDELNSSHFKDPRPVDQKFRLMGCSPRLLMVSSFGASIFGSSTTFRRSLHNFLAIMMMIITAITAIIPASVKAAT